jgi:hypothetical protein
MTRRAFLWQSVAWAAHAPLVVPVNLVLDVHAKWRPRALRSFWSSVWPEAVRDFTRGGMRIETRLVAGGVEKFAFRQPLVTGLYRGVINLVVTDLVPYTWDDGRAVNGVTTRYRGYHLCMVAVHRAHGNQVPMLSLNTCVHEILHALLGDVYEPRPGGMTGQMREARVDWYATRLWLFGDGSPIREPARRYVARLRAESAGS